MQETSSKWNRTAGTPGTRVEALRRTLRDIAMALVGFAILAGAIGWTATPTKPALAADLVAITSPVSRTADPMTATWTHRFGLAAALPQPQLDTGRFLQRTDNTATVALLAAVFTAIIAFNLALLRHLGRVYASSRPGGRRRG